MAGLGKDDGMVTSYGGITKLDEEKNEEVARENDMMRERMEGARRVSQNGGVKEAASVGSCHR